LAEALVVSAWRWKSEARRVLRRAADKSLDEPGERKERNPDAGPRMDTLDDWILFGPRMR
jgi:hypothetical protein